MPSRSHGSTSIERSSATTSRAAVVTDLGTATDGIVECLRGADVIVLEANHDEEIIRRKMEDAAFAQDWEYLDWVRGDLGHLSNRQCAEILTQVVTDRESHVFLAHMSVNHRDPRRDNNDQGKAFAFVRSWLEQRGTPVPYLHRTYRIGRVPGGASTIVEV